MPSLFRRLLWLGLLMGQTPAFAADWQALAVSLDQLRIEGRVPAMGLVIIEGNRPVLISGLGDAGPDTPFRWGSITKSFTALAALRLAETHEIGLDSPIRPIIGPGSYVNRWAPDRPVRLMELLELSAGFADLTRSEFNDNRPLPLRVALERHQNDRATLWPPGLQHSYSNVPPGLTAAVIEAVSGKPFSVYLREQVFDPLGMPDASLAPLAGLPGGFREDGRTAIPYWHMTFDGFGALNASPAEIAGFLSTLLNRGRQNNRPVFSDAIIERFYTPGSTVGARAGLRVGYAAGAYGWVRGGHLYWGHGGDADGYLSRYGLLRAHGRGYALIINTDNPTLFGRMRRQVEAALLADLPSHPQPVEVTGDLSRYPGTYYPTSTRFGAARWQQGESSRAEIRLDGGRLKFEQRGRTTELIHVGSGRFVRPGDPAVTVVIAEGPEGYLFLQGEFGNFVNLSTGPCPGFITRCE